MARIARIVVPHYPHHVTRRGNRRQQTFFSDDDYRPYIELMSHWCGKNGVDIRGYCLMPNHVHPIAVPEQKDALRPAIGEAHRRYPRRVNFREALRGHIWQGLFLCDAGKVSAGLHPLHRYESRQGRTCEASGPMVMDQCRCSYGGVERRFCEGDAVIANGRQGLGGVSAGETGDRSFPCAAPARTDGASAGRYGFY